LFRAAFPVPRVAELRSLLRHRSKPQAPTGIGEVATSFSAPAIN
jgi:hypothetical protein